MTLPISPVLLGVALVVLLIMILAAFLAGAGAYHLIRLMQSRNPIYQQKIPPGVQQFLYQKRMRALLDRLDEDHRMKYLEGLAGYTREKHLEGESRVQEPDKDAQEFLKLVKEARGGKPGK